MAAATRQDDQDTVIQVYIEKKELKEKKENTMTLKDEALVMIGDKVPLILTILETHPVEEHVNAIP